jgi:hypothetical protein
MQHRLVKPACEPPQVCRRAYAIKSDTLVQKMPGDAREIAAARHIIFAPESS